MGWDTDKEEYKQLMRKRAVSLYCPFEDCEDHEKSGRRNIIFIQNTRRAIHKISLSVRRAEEHFQRDMAHRSSTAG